jgi:hypothetical protein
MNYAELKVIIKHIRKTIACSNCQSKLEDDDISVLFTYGSEALLNVNCHKCSNQLAVHISIVEQTHEKSSINITTAQAKKINHNDILEIHTFLNQFDGDFKQLFT